MPRILVLGTDSIATATLKRLHQCFPGCVQLVCGPDPSKNSRKRKGIMTYCDVKRFALDNQIQFQQLDGSVPFRLPQLWGNDLIADWCVVVSFGHMLPTSFINRFEPGHVINMHPSLLPKYRGAAPIPRSIASGDKDVGVSIIALSRDESPIDSGDVILQKKVSLNPDHTYPTVRDHLAVIGAECIEHVIMGNHHSSVVVQDPQLISQAPKIRDIDGVVNFSIQTANEIYNQWRGFYDIINLHCFNGVTRINLEVLSRYTGDFTPQPGCVVYDKTCKVLVIGCKDNTTIGCHRLKVANRGKTMTAVDFHNGYILNRPSVYLTHTLTLH